MKKFTAVLFWLFLAATVLLPTGAVLADESLWNNMTGVAGIRDAYNYGPGAPPSPQAYIANVIKVFLTFLALIFLLVIVWGGFRWMTAGGNDENVKNARNLLKNGIIGFIVIMLSYAILTFIVNVLEETLWWAG